MSAKLLKVARFALLYGPRRTLFKMGGRLRGRLQLRSLKRSRVARDIGLIGCGQFAFSTIAYFLNQQFGPRIAACFDIDADARETLGRTFRVPRITASAEELFKTTELQTVYVASNHASHAAYASQALSLGLNVFVEKPIAVSMSQLVGLVKATKRGGRIYAGYNRPFAGAIRDLHHLIQIELTAPISMQCFVAGHHLRPDHWYRKPEEGTRVCGNIGHWLDLMVHVFAWRGLPDRLDIAITYADSSERDDNLTISIASDCGDLFGLMLTSRCEPFEGINETINIQHGDTICKIDDFRRMTIWRGSRVFRRRYWPKDVGHRLSILQPFSDSPTRRWHEVELSSLLMLHITEMVREGRTESGFSFNASARQFHSEVLTQ